MKGVILSFKECNCMHGCRCEPNGFYDTRGNRWVKAEENTALYNTLEKTKGELDNEKIGCKNIVEYHKSIAKDAHTESKKYKAELKNWKDCKYDSQVKMLKTELARVKISRDEWMDNVDRISADRQEQRDRADENFIALKEWQGMFRKAESELATLKAELSERDGKIERLEGGYRKMGCLNPGVDGECMGCEGEDWCLPCSMLNTAPASPEKGGGG